MYGALKKGTVMNRKKQILLAALMLCILLIGCGKLPQSPSDDTKKPAAEDTEKLTVSETEERTGGDTEAPSGGASPEKADIAELRSRISDRGAMLGVGFFGYVDSESSEAAAREFAAGSALTEAYPSLTDCTLVLTEGAELYALVPANGNTFVTIYPSDISQDGNYIDRKSEPIYIGRAGESVILRCNLSEIFSNVLIAVTDGKSTLEFRPAISLENGRMVQESGCCDFSVYQETAAG